MAAPLLDLLPPPDEVGAGVPSGSGDSSDSAVGAVRGWLGRFGAEGRTGPGVGEGTTALCGCPRLGGPRGWEDGPGSGIGWLGPPYPRGPCPAAARLVRICAAAS